MFTFKRRYVPVKRITITPEGIKSSFMVISKFKEPTYPGITVEEFPGLKGLCPNYES